MRRSVIGCFLKEHGTIMMTKPHKSSERAFTFQTKRITVNELGYFYISIEFFFLLGYISTFGKIIYTCTFNESPYFERLLVSKFTPDYKWNSYISSINYKTISGKKGNGFRIRCARDSFTQYRNMLLNENIKLKTCAMLLNSLVRSRHYYRCYAWHQTRSEIFTRSVLYKRIRSS